MPALDRDRLEDFAQRWLAANRQAESRGDWTGLAAFYADDATYGWNIGPKEDVMCIGITEIREIALGLEMAGLQGWTYPYQRVLIDDKIGEVVGFWKQVALAGEGADVEHREIYGIGGSWFRLNEQYLIEWQRDFFDFGHVQRLYLQLMQEGKLSQGMQERIQRSLAGEKLPGYYPLGQAPVPIW